MTSSRSYYGVVVVVDRQGRHLHCDAWVSVTFRINIGGGTNHAVECLTTKPSEDGVYYFEAVHEFKCAGDFLLEFTATRHRGDVIREEEGGRHEWQGTSRAPALARQGSEPELDCGEQDLPDVTRGGAVPGREHVERA